MPQPSSGWRRRISSKMATGRNAGAASSIGRISVSKRSPSGSARRRVRGDFFCAGRRGSFSIRYPVAALNDALAAATEVLLVLR